MFLLDFSVLTKTDSSLDSNLLVLKNPNHLITHPRGEFNSYLQVENPLSYPLDDGGHNLVESSTRSSKGKKRDLNSRPWAPQTPVLPAELFSHLQPKRLELLLGQSLSLLYYHYTIAAAPTCAVDIISTNTTFGNTPIKKINATNGNSAHTSRRFKSRGKCK